MYTNVCFLFVYMHEYIHAYRMLTYIILKHTHIYVKIHKDRESLNGQGQDSGGHGGALQHTATHCNTLQHSAKRCNTLQHTATHCNTLQRTATHCTTRCSTHVQTHAAIEDLSTLTGKMVVVIVVHCNTATHYSWLMMCCSIVLQ